MGAMAGCHEVLTNMFEYEEEISENKSFSSKMEFHEEADDSESPEGSRLISNPLDMRMIEGRLNAGYYTARGNDTMLSKNGKNNLSETTNNTTTVIVNETNNSKSNNEISDTSDGNTKDENTEGGGPLAFARDMRTIFNNFLKVEEKNTT